MYSTRRIRRRFFGRRRPIVRNFTQSIGTGPFGPRRRRLRRPIHTVSAQSRSLHRISAGGGGAGAGAMSARNRADSRVHVDRRKTAVAPFGQRRRRRDRRPGRIRIGHHFQFDRPLAARRNASWRRNVRRHVRRMGSSGGCSFFADFKWPKKNPLRHFGIFKPSGHFVLIRKQVSNAKGI